jgi:hypothetical protein
MVCSTSLTLALGLLGASLATTFSTRSMALQSEFAASLNDDQLKVYREVVNRRMSLYLQGFVIGILAGVLYLATVPSVKPTPMVLGTFTLIVLGAQYMFYMMIPKGKWMLDFVTTPEQTQKWLSIYRYMSMRWHAGLLFGVLGAMAGCYGCLKT